MERAMVMPSKDFLDKCAKVGLVRVTGLNLITPAGGRKIELAEERMRGYYRIIDGNVIVVTTDGETWFTTTKKTGAVQNSGNIVLEICPNGHSVDIPWEKDSHFNQWEFALRAKWPYPED